MSQRIQQVGRFVVRQARGSVDQLANVATSALVTGAQNLLYGPVRRRSTGVQLDEILVTTASEGVGIPRVYGRHRVAGQIIWLDQPTEQTVVTRSR